MKSNFVRLTFPQFLKKLSSNADSAPLIGALATAAAICCGYISFQFAYRPDFKALRISSNRTEHIDKHLPLRGNHLLWVTEPRDDTPPEVKSTQKDMKAK